MSGPIVRTGSSPEYSDNWDRIFSGGKKPATKSAAEPKAAAKKAAAKKAPKKSAPAKKAKKK